MKLEIKLKDWKSCEGCFCHEYKPRPDSAGLIPPDICGAGYSISHKLIRPKKCIEDNGK